MNNPSGTCPWGGKQQYSSEERARKVRARLTTVNHLRIYKCPNCYQYHFTKRKD